MNAAIPFPRPAPGARRSDARTARAALKADLFGAVPLPGENAADLEALRAALVADLRPASTLEALQVERLAAVAWRLARVERWERCEQSKAAVRERRAEWREGVGLAPTEVEAVVAGGSIALDAEVTRVGAALRAELLAEQRAVLAALTKARALCAGVG